MDTLEQQLNALVKHSSEKLSSEVVDVFTRGINELKQTQMAQKALSVGDEMIHFALPDATSEVTCSKDWLAKGPLVISFYRGGWCPYCNLELQALQQFLPQIQAANATLIAISPEAPDNSLSTREKNALQFPVLSDKDNDVAKAFGLVFRFSDELKTTYQQLKLDLHIVNDSDVFELPLPASYVVDRDGVIRYAFVEEDYRRRSNPADLVEALSAL